MQNMSICNKCQGIKWLDDNKQVVRDAARVGVMGECGIPLSFCTRFESHQSFIGEITLRYPLTYRNLPSALPEQCCKPGNKDATNTLFCHLPI